MAEATGYSLPWIRELAKRDNARGADGIGDRRHHNRGHAPLLAAEQQAALVQAVEEPGPDGDWWSGPQVAARIAQVTGHPVPAQRGWECLQRLGGFTLRVPRPRHVKADPAAQETFIAVCRDIGRATGELDAANARLGAPCSPIHCKNRCKGG